MAHEQVAAFVGSLRDSDGLAARALELCILTAARSGEILGMQWSEIDLERKIWTVPAHRMKAAREHRVPLSVRAVAILRQLGETKTGDLVFPGRARGKPLSNMAMEMVLRRMKIENATVHGFRSSFRDWSSELTNFSNEVCEAALAHVIKNKAEAAYRRGDLLEKRRKLMEAWAAYGEPKRMANVLRMRRG
jgi:integrase